MAWQFQIDGRPAAPIQAEKRDAHADAVRLGYAVWTRDKTAIRLDPTAGGEIAKVKEPRP